MILTAAQIRETQALLGWTPATLAKQAALTFDDVSKALDGVEIRRPLCIQLDPPPQARPAL